MEYERPMIVSREVVAHLVITPVTSDNSTPS
jgi:hypothetical protein